MDTVMVPPATVRAVEYAGLTASALNIVKPDLCICTSIRRRSEGRNRQSKKTVGEERKR